jgi:hypothetical protein
MRVGDLVRLGGNHKFYLGIITAANLINNIPHFDVVFFKDCLGHIKNLSGSSLEVINESR